MHIRDWIIENCFTKTGGLNNRVSFRSWWINRGSEKELLEVESLTTETDNITERLWCVINGQPPTCPTCGSRPNFKQFKSGYHVHCSRACAWADEDRNRRIGENHDYAKTQERVKATNLERYGVEHGFSRKEVIEKITDTKIERYGTLNPATSKIASTCEERYGSTSWFGSEGGKARLSSIRDEHGGCLKLDPDVAKAINDVDKLWEMNQTMSIGEIAQNIGVTGKVIGYKLREAGLEPIRYSTKYGKSQTEILDFVKSIRPDLTVHNNYRKAIPPREIDIYVPQMRVGIEHNGEFWHSYRSEESEDEKHYHKNKRDEALVQGIRLIQIPEFDWRDRRNACESMIESAIGVSMTPIRSSKCSIEEIETSVANAFYERNHIHGGLTRVGRTLGLVINGLLVACMSIGKSRFTDAYDSELTRYATLRGYRVHGGFGRLLKTFGDVGLLVTYCDLSFFTGSTYVKSGFTFKHESSPNYWYVRGGVRLSRYSAQKHKLPRLLGDGFDPNLSESRNMFNSGYVRYWNCGNSVWVKDTHDRTEDHS